MTFEPLKNKIKRVWITFNNPDVEDVITWSEVDILSKKDVKSAVRGLKKELQEFIKLDGYSDIYAKMTGNPEDDLIAQYNKGYFTALKDVIKKIDKWFEDVNK